MPVKKTASKKGATSTRTRKTKTAAKEPPVMEPPMPPSSSFSSSINEDHDCCFTNDCSMPYVQQEVGGTFGRRILWTLLGILLAYGVVFLGTLIRNNLEAYRYIGQAEKQERTITVEAEGRVTAKPDIAMTRMGMSIEGVTVADAQAENSRVMNELLQKLQALGVDEEDIQTTDYTIFPQYEYSEENGRTLRGYQVSQNVTVKIREIDNANAVLALAGEVGANNVSGIDFTLDDKDVYVEQAREEAMQQLREKAQALATMLGVRVVGVVSYDEFEAGGADHTYPVLREAYALGGAAPQIESGSTDIVMTVRAVLEIQ